MFYRRLRCFLILILFFAVSANAQQPYQEFAKGRIFFYDGLVLEGEKLRLTPTTVALEVMGQNQVYAITEIFQVMGKDNSGHLYGRTCAGACVLVNLLPLLTGGYNYPSDGEGGDEFRQVVFGLQVASAAFYGGLSYGVGYLYGKAKDDWKVLYLKRK